MLKIGLTQRVDCIIDRGERRDALDQRWAVRLAEWGYLSIPLPNRAALVDELLTGLGLAGVILTGGNDIADLPGATNTAPQRDAFERRLIERCTACGIPILGVCRGMQMLAAYYSARLVRVDGHVAARHLLKVLRTSVMPLSDRREVNSYHEYAIDPASVNDDLQVVAAAPDGTPEAIVHRTLAQWGIMWHPERGPQDDADARLLHTLFGGMRS